MFNFPACTLSPWVRPSCEGEQEDIADRRELTGRWVFSPLGFYWDLRSTLPFVSNLYILEVKLELEAMLAEEQGDITAQLSKD